jgi:hypothetical protein
LFAKYKDLSKVIRSLEPPESVIKEYGSFAELKEKLDAIERNFKERENDLNEAFVFFDKING